MSARCAVTAAIAVFALGAAAPREGRAERPHRPTPVSVRFDGGYGARTLYALDVTGADLGAAIGGRHAGVVAWWVAPRFSLVATDNGLSVWSVRGGPEIEGILGRVRIGVGLAPAILGIHRAVRGETILGFGVEGRLLTIQLAATDPDLPNDVLRFSLPVAPVGMTVDPVNGSILWSPHREQAGRHAVTARVADAGGRADEESFTIDVDALGSPPELQPIDDRELVESTPLSVQAIATDPDAGDVLVYSLPLAPEGMTIAPASGAIGWTPTAAQVGAHDVTVEVRDSRGLVDFTSFVDNTGTAQTANTNLSGSTNAQRGYRFTVTEDVLLTDLGKFEPTGNAKTVTLFDFSSQAILAERGTSA